MGRVLVCTVLLIIGISGVGHAGCGTSTAHLVDYERRAVLEP